MTQPDPSLKTDERTNRTARPATAYTVETDVTLVYSEGVEEVEPFRLTVDADSVENAVDAFQRRARERLVDDGPFADVRCPPFPGYGDYRLGE